MKLKRVMIAAPGSGSGKTTVTCALLHTLKKMGLQAVSYKCGPDYIDPMFHEKVLGVPSKNLDTFFTGEEETRALFLKNRREEEFVVMEGVMGLYDGLGGVREEGSSYHLARVTETPIILVVDAKGMGRSVIPLIAGFLAYDSVRLIKGVILNRVRGSYYEMIGPLIQKELGIHVVGYFEQQEQLRIGSRHLGLTMPHEIAHSRAWLEALSETFQKMVSVEKIIQIAKQAKTLTATAEEADHRRTAGKSAPVIAVARDESFCFYYEDNLLMLKEYGARIEYFSPLRDKKLPDGCSGILIGGGYPELYADALGANMELLAEIRRAFENQMPTVAECGGFMYLHSAVKDKEGNSRAMVGAIPGVCFDTGRLVRFGYVELEEKGGFFLPEGEKIRGHEFHYYDSVDNGHGCLAVRPVSGKSYPCVMVGEHYWLGFPHLYYPSNPSFVRSFLDKAIAYEKERGRAHV